VSESKVFRRISAPKRDEGRNGYTIRNSVMCIASLSILIRVKGRRLQWAKYVAWMI
jgi:hypothetical protein